MKKMAITKLAASTLVLGVTMVGFGMNGQAKSQVSVSDEQVVSKAASAAKKAAKALTKQKLEKAIAFAEIAVGMQPRNAGYRMLLGQAYLAAGRFQSAETSFTDTLTLDPERERAALNLALTQIALGKGDAARSTLADYRDKLPAADFGLAVALSGNAEEAVRVLEFATRAPDATAKTRQNLALAYALAGKWTNAKVMAVQDLTPDEADARLSQWATFVRPGTSRDQVASLLGVKPQDDMGQPMRLALAPSATQVAAVMPIIEAVPVQTAAVVEPEAQPVFETPAVVTPVAVASPVAPSLIRAPATPMRQAVAVRAPIKRTAEGVRTASNGKFVVQLGAFSNATAAERAWNKMSGRFGLSAFDPANGAAKARNANLVRLSVVGFGTREDAGRLCAQVRQSGGACFVRMQEGDATARWVQRNTPIKVASR